MAAKPLLLRRHGESRIELELRRLGAMLADEFPTDILGQRLADRLADPATLAVFLDGFGGGLAEGAGERLRAWEADLQQTLSALLAFIQKQGAFQLAVAVDVSLYEFLRGAFSPERPAGLAPEVVDALDRLELVHALEPALVLLGPLDQALQALGFLELIGMLAEDIAISVIQAGGQWIFKFLAADTSEQGRLLGRFLGEAVVELARAFIEPPEIGLAELAANLAMTPDEVADVAGVPP
jgi:hypothetical protein